MFNVSSKYKKIIAQPGREFWYKVIITLRSGETLELGGHDIMEGGLTVDQTASIVGQFGLGDVTASELNLQLNNFTGKFENMDFEGAEIVPFVGLVVELHWEKGEVLEWVKMGTFTAEATDTRGATVNIKAYDHMMNFATPYVQCDLSYPATLRQVLESCCLDCGVPLLTHDFTNADYVVDTRPDDGALTYRDVVSHVATLAGCFTRLTPEGALELAWYDMENPSIELKNVTNFWAQDLTITGVMMGPYREGEPTYLNGEKGYTIDIFNNPLAQENRIPLCRAIGGKINGFTFRPFSYTGPSNPAVNAGDTAVFYDRRGNQYKTVITYTMYRAGSNQKFTAEAQTPAVKNFSFFGIAEKAQEAAKNDTKRQISAYDTEAKRFASLAAASVGGYPSQEVLDDGSTIYYYHDKPGRSESRYIRKVSGEGTFISSDGGKTWAGIDKDANALLNNLSVRTINADMIRAGRIEAQSGGAYFDLDRGELSATKLISDIYPEFVTTIGPSEAGEEGALNVTSEGRNMLSVYEVGDADGNPGTVWTAPWLNNSAGTNRKGVAIGTDSTTLFADHNRHTRGIRARNNGDVEILGNLVLASEDSKGKLSTVLSTIGTEINVWTNLNMNTYSILNPSDERLKANIQDYSGDALEVVDNIALKSYDWRESGEHKKIGYIAQQMEKIEPNLVVKEKDGTYAVKPLELIPYLIGAVQQLKKEIEELKENR